MVLDKEVGGDVMRGWRKLILSRSAREAVAGIV
jgi:hypothetical protein